MAASRISCTRPTIYAGFPTLRGAVAYRHYHLNLDLVRTLRAEAQIAILNRFHCF